MIVFELTNNEADPAYQNLEISNINRQYDFLRSIVNASIEAKRPFISSHVIKALNFQAITCLHTNAGEFRPCQVEVGDYIPPAQHRVQALMDDLVNIVNRNWDSTDAVVLACYVLWKLNHIHPFINGNGRTARATSYFVLCIKSGGLLPGKIILPELITRERPTYIAALKHADESLKNGNLDLAPLHTLVSNLLKEQIDGAAQQTN